MYNAAKACLFVFQNTETAFKKDEIYDCDWPTSLVEPVFKTWAWSLRSSEIVHIAWRNSYKQQPENGMSPPEMRVLI